MIFDFQMLGGLMLADKRVICTDKVSEVPTEYLKK